MKVKEGSSKSPALAGARSAAGESGGFAPAEFFHSDFVVLSASQTSIAQRQVVHD
jgi:hypothetical protein